MGRFDDEDPVDLDDVEFITETDKAILVKIDGEDTWLPKSQIVSQDVYKRGDVGTVTITAWLADEKGLG